VWIFLVQPTGEVTAIALAVGPLVAGSVRG
jgi:hypothetical protein